MTDTWALRATLVTPVSQALTWLSIKEKQAKTGRERGVWHTFCTFEKAS
jgi:hypothetical protein